MYEMLVLMGTVFLGSFLLAKALLMAKRKPTKLTLLPGAKLKVLTPSGAYRCHVESSNEKGFIVSSPLHRDSYVPLRMGEKLIVQTPHDNRLLTFHTSIVSRDGVNHRLTLAHPTAYKFSERRSVPRTKFLQNVPAELNGHAATLTEVSTRGARLLTMERFNPGDVVNIDFLQKIGQVSGAVLGAEPAAIGNRMGRELRIAFDDPVPALRVKDRTSLQLRFQ